MSRGDLYSLPRDLPVPVDDGFPDDCGLMVNDSLKGRLSGV
jgi:hypothetical protein